jgi:hypothetical protein
MTSRFSEIIIDCHNPRALAEFWCGALGYRVIDQDEGDGAVEIASWEPEAEAIRAAPVPPTLEFISGEIQSSAAHELGHAVGLGHQDSCLLNGTHRRTSVGWLRYQYSPMG